MDFGFTEEQELLRAEARKWLDRNCPMDEVRKVTEAEGGEGFSRQHWKAIAELGWLGLAIPEAHGGAGLGQVDLVVLLEETGRSLFPSPLLANTMAAAAIQEAGSDAQQAALLPGLADGSVIGTLALQEDAGAPQGSRIRLEAERDGDEALLRGEKLFVQNAGAADLLVVACRVGDEPRLAVVRSDAEGVHAADEPGMDLTKRLGRVRFDGARAELLAAGGAALLARVIDRATAALTAEMIGVAEGAVALTADYAKERLQFGSPIGRYQGVKHPLAEMYVDVESFKSLLYYAAWCLDESPEEAPRYVSMAKAYASEALARIGIDAVQLHGAVGYTWEFDAHLYLKRSKWARPLFGDSDFHYERVAALGGL
jgi:alkylation response protein AidB-like acyl-CoA dehydrogenase